MKPIKTTIFAVVLFLLPMTVLADPPRMNLELKWAYNTHKNIGDVELVDGNGDGRKEIYVGLVNNTILVFDSRGVKTGEFYVGNASQLGRINSIASGDIDADGVEELLLGLGGAKEVRTYEAQDFSINPDEITMTVKDKVLYRVIRYHGGVYAMKPDGRILWRYLTDDSVKAVAFVPRAAGGGYIAAGVGDLTIYIYNERSDEPLSGTTCYTEYVEDEESGWGSATDCATKACVGLNKCTSRWDNSLVEAGHPEKGTKDTCYISYDKQICEKDVAGEKVGWRFVEYEEKNGTVMFLDSNGRYMQRFDVRLKDDENRVVAGADNSISAIRVDDLRGNNQYDVEVASNNGEFLVLNASETGSVYALWGAKVAYLKDVETSAIKWHQGAEVRSIYSGDINNDRHKEVVAGTGEGQIVAYDSEGNLLWKQRIDDAVTGMSIVDVEGDEMGEVIVTSRDGNIYTYDSTGALEWTYPHKIPLYGLNVADIDKNDLQDFIVRTTGNLTRYETNEYFIKKFRADTLYNVAFDAFNGGDYTKASIYVDKALETYKSIRDKDGMPKCNLLRNKIDQEFKLKKKTEGDQQYNLALKYYSMNNFQNAIKYVNQAKEIYKSLGADEDVDKCDRMLATMGDEEKLQRKITADGYYNKAASLVNFGNYTGALEWIERAKAMYQELEYYNETVRCDILVISIADRHYRMALTAYEANDYPQVIKLATFARDLYVKANGYNASYSAADLARRANESMIKKTAPAPTEGVYIPYAVGAIVLVIVMIVFMRMKTPKTPPVRLPEKKAEEDLDDIEKGV